MVLIQTGDLLTHTGCAGTTSAPRTELSGDSASQLEELPR